MVRRLLKPPLSALAMFTDSVSLLRRIIVAGQPVAGIVFNAAWILV